MVRPNYNLIRFIRRNIRMMKKEYGGPITIYRLNTTTTNLQTGTKTADRDSVYVRRAVVLPNRLSRDAIQSISLLASYNKIAQGGTYDPGQRRFIIDRSDVSSSWELSQDDWIVYNNKRYDIKTIDDFEQNTAWLVVAREIESVTPEQDKYGYPDNYIEFSDSVSYTVA